MRLFIAIEVLEDIKEYISELQEQIDTQNNKIGLVNKNSIHLTLKFLGEVQSSKLEEIKNNLKKITFKPFSVVLDNIGFFPSESNIRVIWIGLKPEDHVIELQKNIDDNLKSFFKKEKDFKPHLTLARVKYIENKTDFIAKLKNLQVKKLSFGVRSFFLIESELTPERPIYNTLETYSQGKPF